MSLVSEIQRAAEWYLERGLFPIPLHPVIPGVKRSGKAPIGRWKDWTREKLKRVVWENVNIGIECGRSGIVVADADSQEGLEFALSHFAPTGTIVETGSGGRHLWYKAPEGIVVNSRYRVAGLGLDIIAQGQVVAPPSKHWSGGTYKFLRENGITVFDPEWIPKEETYPIPKNDQEPDEFWNDRRLRSYVSRIQSISGQGGDSACFKAACFLVKHRPAEVAWEELKIWNSFCAKPAWSEKRLRYKLEQALKAKH